LNDNKVLKTGSALHILCVFFLTCMSVVSLAQTHRPLPAHGGANTSELLRPVGRLAESHLAGYVVYPETGAFGPVTSVAFSPDGSLVAAGGYRVATVFDATTGQVRLRLPGHAGVITSLAFSPNGALLAAAGGSPGQAGEVKLWNVRTGKLLQTLDGPNDVVYSVAFRPDGRQLAAASYDHLVWLYTLSTVSTKSSAPPRISAPRRLKDHTDAVYAVAFSPDGGLLASAAGDRTVKVWDTRTGKRLYSLSESTAELYALAFRPDGKQLAAGGVDKTLRTWNVSHNGGTPARSAFAHEGAILRIAYAHKGDTIVSCGEDGAVKRWDAETLAERKVYPPQPDWPQGLALSPDGHLVAVGRHDGSLAIYDAETGRLLRAPLKGAAHSDKRSISSLNLALLLNTMLLMPGDDPEVMRTTGNDVLEKAQRVPVPVSINGKLWNDKADSPAPSHYYRFQAKRGESLVIEVLARRTGSPLDSQIEILDAQGKPVERAVLRAIGRTEVTLSDRDSVSPGIRLLLVPDLQINDYVLAGREVIQVLAMPKGPDDDYPFRSYRGQRLGFFGTTPEFHSVGAPVYKVEVHPPGSVFSSNGLPLTHLYYANDDGGPLYGRDSYLEFSAPADGEYIVRLTDVRGQQGDKYTYRLRIHPPRPDFKILASPARPGIPKGGAAFLNVECERYEGFNAPIAVHVEGLPAGFTATEGEIEAGETACSLLLTAAPNAATPNAPLPGSFRVVARGRLYGQDVVRMVEPDEKTGRLAVVPPSDLKVAVDTREVAIHPGGDAVFEVRIERLNKFAGRVPVEVRNLPFGVKVENVGLNGILITEKETARKVYLHCEPWVKPQTRLIYTMGNVEGGTGTVALPIVLKVEASSTAFR
jgi:WD40 repeat protein